MRIEQLKYFIEIAKNQSIKGASENLYLTQQSLSQTMKNLEKELGFLLLNRVANGITLTEEGQLFAAFAQKVLDEQQIFWQQIEDLHNATDKTQTGTLMIKLVGLFDVCVLPEILNKFCLHYPNVVINTETMDLADIEENIERQKHDLVGLITLPSYKVTDYARYLQKRQMRLISFGQGNYQLCCNKNHPLKIGYTAVPLEAAMKYPIVQYNNTIKADCSANDTLHQLLQQHGYGSKEYFLLTRSLHTWIANLLYSDKIGFLHELILRDALERYETFRELAVLPTKETLSGTLGCIVHAKCSPLVQKFVAFLPKGLPNET